MSLEYVVIVSLASPTAGHFAFLINLYPPGVSQWYGPVSRSSGLTKTILHGTVKRGRRRGRQKKWWADNIREWTGLEFGKSQRVVEN